MKTDKTPQVWATLHRKNRVVRETLFPCPPEQVLQSGLQLACKEFDVSCPVVLNKHERELCQFSRTSFSPNDFLDAFPYTTLALEIFLPDNPDRKILPIHKV